MKTNFAAMLLKVETLSKVYEKRLMKHFSLKFGALSNSGTEWDLPNHRQEANSLSEFKTLLREWTGF